MFNRFKNVNGKQQQDICAIVSEEDVFDFDTSKGLPYLKYVDLLKLEPSHFGLTKWTTNIKLPPIWMKKIYSSDVYRDTDMPEKETEKFSHHQLQIINEHTMDRRRRENVLMLDYRRRENPCDDLDSYMNVIRDSPEIIQIDDDNSSLATIEHDRCSPIGSEVDVANCCRHKFQPESKIVESALEKMKRLDPDKEKQFQELIRDKKAMDLLSNLVSNYLKASKD